MKSFTQINSTASNYSGVRPSINYGNVIDQKRYIYALNYVNGKKILDCATGIGWGAFIMANAGAQSVMGIDISSNAIRDAIEFYPHNKILYKVASPDELILEYRFDVITCFETIEHVDDALKFLSSLHNLAHKETVFLLSTPNEYCTGVINGLPANPYHAKEFSKIELLKLIEDSGWKVDAYLGQHLLKRDSPQVLQYRKFNKNYWRNYKLTKKLGFTFKVFSRLKNYIIPAKIDPALFECTPRECDEHHEPVCHYFQLSIKNS